MSLVALNEVAAGAAELVVLEGVAAWIGAA